jgi:hypothetical protein
MDISGWIASLENAARGVSEWTGAAFWRGINEWRATYGAIIDARKKLRENPPSANSDPVVKSEYASLTSRMDTLYARASWINGEIEKIIPPVASGMGALPLVPAVLVAAILSVTYIAKVLVDEIARYVRERQYVRAAAASGKSELQAMAEFQRNNPVGGGLFGDASRLVWPVAIVGALYLFLTENRK